MCGAARLHDCGRHPWSPVAWVDLGLVEECSRWVQRYAAGFKCCDSQQPSHQPWRLDRVASHHHHSPLRHANICMHACMHMRIMPRIHSPHVCFSSRALPCTPRKIGRNKDLSLPSAAADYCQKREGLHNDTSVLVGMPCTPSIDSAQPALRAHKCAGSGCRSLGAERCPGRYRCPTWQLALAGLPQ